MAARSTNAPVLTERKRVIAGRIVDTVAQAGGEVVGQANLAAMAGLTRRQVNRVMWAGVLAADEKLSAALIVQRHGDGYHYRLTTDPDEIEAAMWAPLRTAMTKVVRVNATLNSPSAMADLRLAATKGNLGVVIAAMDNLDTVYRMSREKTPA